MGDCCVSQIGSTGQVSGVSTTKENERLLPWPLNQVSGNLEICVFNQRYTFSGDQNGASRVYLEIFKEHEKILLKRGENAIEITFCGRGTWSWDKKGEKAVKLAVNEIACQPLEDKDVAEADRNDPYINMPAKGGESRTIRFALPPEVVKSGAITKLEVLVGAGSAICLTVLQPKLLKITDLRVPQAPTRVEKTVEIVRDPKAVKAIDPNNLGASFSKIWGIGSIIQNLIYFNEDGSIRIKGSTKGASGMFFENQDVQVMPGSKLRVDLEVIGNPKWDRPRMLKVEINDKALKPATHFNGDEKDPYIGVFSGRQTLEFSLEGIGSINKLQPVIAVGENIHLVIHKISIVKK